MTALWMVCCKGAPARLSPMPQQGYDSGGREGMHQCYLCSTKLSSLALLMISKDLEDA